MITYIVLALILVLLTNIALLIRLIQLQKKINTLETIIYALGMKVLFKK